MSMQGNAPRMATWVICLVLFVIALAARFGGLQLPPPMATWSWVIGYALLLVAVRVRGL
jgi:hypothetical protein